MKGKRVKRTTKGKMKQRPAKGKPSAEWRSRREFAVGVLIGLLLVGSLFLVAG